MGRILITLINKSKTKLQPFIPPLNVCNKSIYYNQKTQKNPCAQRKKNIEIRKLIVNRRIQTIYLKQITNSLVLNKSNTGLECFFYDSLSDEVFEEPYDHQKQTNVLK